MPAPEEEEEEVARASRPPEGVDGLLAACLLDGSHLRSFPGRLCDLPYLGLLMEEIIRGQPHSLKV